MATATALAVCSALVTAVVVPVAGWLLAPLALLAGYLGWWLGTFLYVVLRNRLGMRRSRHEAEQEYERRTGTPFPGWPKKRRGDEPPDGLPAGP